MKLQDQHPLTEVVWYLHSGNIGNYLESAATALLLSLHRDMS
ncbi:hypothetical protein [Candidatus Erwinia haradaeae]|nr:hypothetical protein [Candidatus Erwinia haradaeae]